MTTGGQNQWRDGRSVKKKKTLYITESPPVLQVSVRFSYREVDEGYYFSFLGLQGNLAYEGNTGFANN